MLEGRFEPAGGGLRLVWAFWGCGGVAHAGMCCCVGSEAASRAPGRRGGSRAQFAQLSVRSNRLFSAARRLERPREAGRLKDDSERGDLQRSDVPIWGWKQAFLPRRSRFTALAWSMLLNPRRLGTSPSFGVCRGCFRPGGDTGGLLEGSQESDASAARAARQLTHMTPADSSHASPGALQGPLTAVREVQAVLPAKAGVW